MAVVSVREVGLGREGARTQPGRILRRRRFIVQTDHNHDESLVVENAPGLPRLYEPYVTATVQDPRCIVRTVVPRQRDNHRNIWDVDVEYDSEFVLAENPFLEPPDIRVDSETYEEPLPGRAAVFYNPDQQQPESEDPAEAGGALQVWGQGITTSAGEPYDPPATRTASRPVVIFTRNEGSFTIAKKVEFENTVNQVPWSGLQRRQAWLRSIKAQVHKQEQVDLQQPPIWYWRVEYTFALKGETWDLFLLDIGSYYLEYPVGGGDPIRVPFKVEGTGEKRLGLLDNSDDEQPGKKLLDGQSAKFNRWRVYREKDYAPLQINLNLALEQIAPRRRRA